VAERSGLEFVPTLSADEYGSMMSHPDLWHPRRGMRIILDRELMRRYLPVIYEAIRERYERGHTVAVGSSLAFSARTARDSLGIPYATLHLQPMACCSVADPPVDSSGLNMTWLPRPLIRLAYWGAEKWITDPLMAPAINEFRQTLGLPPVRRILTRWSPSPTRVIGLFPEWFGSIPDGGPSFRHAGFVLFDGSLPDGYKGALQIAAFASLVLSATALGRPRAPTEAEQADTTPERASAGYAPAGSDPVH